MGNLRRLLTLLALFVFFWPMGNPDDPSVPGLLASQNYAFLIAITWAGILLGIISEGWKEGDGVLDALFLAFFMLGVFEVLFSLSLGGKINALHLIPLLYTTYFLGRLVDPDDFAGYLPYVFALGILFVFLTAAYQLVMYAGMQMRFGTRTAFFAPVGIVFGTYMLTREEGLLRRGIFLGTVILSVVVLVLFGNRTAYLSVFVLFTLLLWVTRLERKVRAALLTVSGIIASGIFGVLALGTAYVGPIFLRYVFQRFMSIFTKLGKGQDLSVIIRKYDIANALDRWRLEPFFGRSISDYLLRGLEGSKIIVVDNSFVTFLWKYGALGLTVFLSLLLYSTYALWKLLKVELSPFTLLTLLTLVNLLVISISTSVFTTYVHVANLSLLLGIVSTKLGDVRPYNTGSEAR